LGISENKGTSRWNLIPSVNFFRGTRTVAIVINLVGPLREYHTELQPLFITPLS